MQSLWIALIPAYQPTDQLLLLLQEAKSKGFQLVVIDDGSDKSLNEIFASAVWFGTVLHHEQNMGKGQAIKTGLSYIDVYKRQAHRGKIWATTLDEKSLKIIVSLPVN